MKFNFWGAAGTVTGSMHLLEIGGRQLLLDCGLYQGRRKEAFKINREIPFDARKVDAVVLSHAHIDHSGNLPSLVRSGFDGPIYCTSATRDLAARMLLDSAKIQESDVRYVNKVRRRKNQRPFEPLYTKRDALETTKKLVPIDYGRSFKPLDDVRGIFWDAGHMLGSASVSLDVSENGRTRRIAFSGDIGRPETPILRNPRVVPEAEILIMESTYGNRIHANRAEIRSQLAETIRAADQQGGKVVIPAFAVGRTQEIVYHLNHLWESDDGLPVVPTFVDSPLAVDVTDVYRAHPECYDEEMYDAVLDEEDRDPLGFNHLRYVRSVGESKSLNDLKAAAIIISASGMCEAGRILHHLKNNIEKPETVVLFAGYQAPHTLGRRILNGAEFVPILGREYKMRARVDRIEGCSAHADRSELLAWADEAASYNKLRRVFLVHGESDAATALAEGLREQGVPSVDVPARGESFEV